MNLIEIEYKGVKFDVEFDYSPEEPMVMYYPDGSGYPGAPAELIITDILYKETSFLELLEEYIEDLTELTELTFLEQI